MPYRHPVSPRDYRSWSQALAPNHQVPLADLKLYLGLR